MSRARHKRERGGATKPVWEAGGDTNAAKEAEEKKHGGKVHKATGGRVDSVSKADPLAKTKGGPDKVSKSEPLTKPGSKDYEAGAATGEGRLEKEKAYGRNAGKAAKSSSTS